MKITTSNRRFCALLPLLLFIPLTGCYTFQQIGGTGETTADEIEVTTAARETYVLRSWSVDDSGTIRGTVQSLHVSVDDRTSRRWINGDLQNHATSGLSSPTVSIPTSDVSMIRVKRLDTGKTVAASFGVVAVGAGIILMVDLVQAYQKAGRSASPAIGIVTIGP